MMSIHPNKTPQPVPLTLTGVGGGRRGRRVDEEDTNMAAGGGEVE